MTQLPRIPDGPFPLVQWAREIMRCIQERTLRSSPDIMIQEGPTGVTLRVRATPGGGSTSGDKPVWL
jgi:hypothetical protein